MDFDNFKYYDENGMKFAKSGNLVFVIKNAKEIQAYSAGRVYGEYFFHLKFKFKGKWEVYEAFFNGKDKTKKCLLEEDTKKIIESIIKAIDKLDKKVVSIAEIEWLTSKIKDNETNISLLQNEIDEKKKKRGRLAKRYLEAKKYLL